VVDIGFPMLGGNMKENGLSRRSFLKGAAFAGASAAAAGLVACAGSPGDASGGGDNGGAKVSWTQEAEIVIVGGGASGAAAALAAAEAGASVILLEHSSALGGSGALCVGSVTTCATKMQADAGISDSVEKYLADVEELVGAETIKRAGDDWDLFKLQAQEGGRTVDWLVEQGVVFQGPYEYPHHSVPRLHALYPSSAAWPAVIQPKITAAGGDIKLQTKGVELVTEGGKVVGVKAIDQISREELFFKGTKGVILASASIDASYDQLIKRYSTTLSACDPSCRFNDGFGIKMAAKLGANTTEYNSAAGISLRCQAPGPDVGAYTKQAWMPYGIRDAGAIMVTSEGKRYASEDLGESEMIPKVSALPDHVAYMVYDDFIARQFQVSPDMVVSSIPGTAWGTVDDFVAMGGIMKANTIEEVASLAGVNPAGLAAEVAKYNEYAVAGNDPDFGRKKFGLAEANTLNKGLTTPPYYIHGPQKGEVIQGGLTLSINTNFEVLDVFGEVIPGLYAVGIGGHGLSPQGGGGHGGNMAWAFTSGRVAGTRLASL
jgi:fumarate reductase flavoprotein subunit